VTIPLTDAPRVDAGRGPDSACWPDRGPLWTDELEAWLPAFVGRARELDRLGDLLAEAAAGRPRIAVIEGEAGLGKSSLITEFLSRHREVPVLAASGELSEQALPWGMVRQLARRADTDQGAGLTLPAGPAASADPLLVGEELMALIAARSVRGVLAVVIEDLQWGWPWGRRGAQIRLIRIKGLPNRRC
jgi:AAA ATPase domain